jgi:WD40 repeat protein
MAFFEEGSHTVHFMDPDTGDCMNKSLVINPKQLVVNMSTVKKNKEGKIEIKKKELIVPTGIRVLALLYINDDKYHLLMTATSDGFVRGWKFSTATGFVLATQPDNEEEFVEHQFDQEIYCIAWDGLNEVLYCSQKDGSIVLWNLKTDTEKRL